MATNDILIGFALDQSGSMSGTETETRKGFNAFIEEQANQPGNAWVSMVLFDTKSAVRYQAGPIALVDQLGTTTNPYNPSGGTALYDAVADTINLCADWLTQQNPPFDGQVVIAILTDGGENSSTRTNIDQLNDLIRDKKENHGWEFVFLGSGGASWTEGQKFAAMGVNTLNYAGAAVAGSTMSTYGAVSQSITTTRQKGSRLTANFVNSTAGLNADPTMGQVDPNLMVTPTESSDNDEENASA